MMERNQQLMKAGSKAVVIRGITVRLIFSAQENCDAPVIVGKILKNAYLQHQGV